MSPSTSRSLTAVFLLACAAGVFFRVFHVDWKLYGFDESVTSLRAAGYSIADFEGFVSDGRVHDLRTLEVFQAPSRAMDERAVWRSLALEDPQHPPLYFWITSLFERVSGDSVFLRRVPAVVFGLLVLPAMWWLAYELFDDRLVAWCVAALVAVSPFHLAYAQEAREYSLWTLACALSSALFLRYLRGAGTWTWAGYAAGVALGLWSFTLFAQTVAAHALYLATPWSGASRRSRVLAATAMALGVVSFVPWISVMVAGARRAASDTSWSSAQLSIPLYAGKWLFNAGSVFFDLDYLSIALAPVAIVLLGLALVCCIVLVRTTPPRMWGFVVLQGAVAALSLLALDLAFHQSRAIEARYLIPLWLSLELATGYALAMGSRRNTAWRAATAVVLVAGIASCSVSAFARTWWITSWQKTLPAIAAALEREPGVTLVYWGADYTLLGLLPISRTDLRFRCNEDLDPTALRSAPNPFVIAKPSDVETLGSRRVRRVTLPPSFPPAEDYLIALLHRRAAAGRNIGRYQEDALYVPSVRQTPISGLPVRRCPGALP